MRNKRKPDHKRVNKHANLTKGYMAEIKPAKYDIVLCFMQHW